MKHPSKITLLIIGLLLVSSYSVLLQTINAGEEITTQGTQNSPSDQTYENLEMVPFYVSLFAGSPSPVGYSPRQIRSAYNLPNTGGAGTTIAIIDAYDTPSILNDYNVFSHQYGLPDNSTGSLIVYKMPGTYETDSDWANETCLDVEWAHAIAPNATILLVEAPNSSTTELYAAVDYATSQPGVVAVSMSWGLKNGEVPYETIWDYHFNKTGIVFFASSGDNGAGTTYPASSPNVVAVGGTVLTMYGTQFVSETGWSGSGGGVSTYEPMPDYQKNFGLITSGSKRAVPDVSYNAGAGVAVCCGGLWYSLGGTSAGAPQWAAIHAIAISASNTNLYNRAKTMYATCFRDIKTGSNGYGAGIGYDYVSGLGSPLTIDFSNSFMVTPIFGAAGTPIMLTGNGLSGTIANITYLNPLTSTWIPLVNNTAVTAGSVTFNTTAPDLMAGNQPGEFLQNYDQIIFQVTDNLGNAYNTTTPFNEYRRGLCSVENYTTTGVFGNNTTIGYSLLTQSGGNITVSGQGFSAGNATIFWDNTNVSNTIINQTGSFNTNITLPASTQDYHTLTIQDSTSNFTINIASQPIITNNYDEQWHTSEFIITLTNDSNIDEIYYRINGGDTQTVTANGQPTITTSSANNTLEYWCNWTINGISLQTAHILLKDIKLDKTTPTEQPQVTNAPQASTSTKPTTTPQATHITPATTSPTNEPAATPIPEFSSGAALLLLGLASLLLVLVVKKRQAYIRN
jgi:hypothetical protein